MARAPEEAAGDRRAAGLSPPEELLARVLPRGGVRLTWFYDELLLEQLAAGCAQVARLAFEVRQLSEGAQGRLRVRTHECPCRPPGVSGEVREQACELDGCMPGRVYEFSVRACATIEGGEQKVYSEYSNNCTIGIPPDVNSVSPGSALRDDEEPQRFREPSSPEAMDASEARALTPPPAPAVQRGQPGIRPLQAQSAGRLRGELPSPTDKVGYGGHSSEEQVEASWKFRARSLSPEPPPDGPSAQPDSEPSPTSLAAWHGRRRAPSARRQTKQLRWALQGQRTPPPSPPAAPKEPSAQAPARALSPAGRTHAPETAHARAASPGLHKAAHCDVPDSGAADTSEAVAAGGSGATPDGSAVTRAPAQASVNSHIWRPSVVRPYMTIRPCASTPCMLGSPETNAGGTSPIRSAASAMPSGAPRWAAQAPPSSPLTAGRSSPTRLVRPPSPGARATASQPPLAWSPRGWHAAPQSVYAMRGSYSPRVGSPMAAAVSPVQHQVAQVASHDSRTFAVGTQMVGVPLRGGSPQPAAREFVWPHAADGSAIAAEANGSPRIGSCTGSMAALQGLQAAGSHRRSLSELGQLSPPASSTPGAAPRLSVMAATPVTPAAPLPSQMFTWPTTPPPPPSLRASAARMPLAPVQAGLSHAASARCLAMPQKAVQAGAGVALQAAAARAPSRRSDENSMP